MSRLPIPSVATASFTSAFGNVSGEVIGNLILNSFGSAVQYTAKEWVAKAFNSIPKHLQETKRGQIAKTRKKLHSIYNELSAVETDALIVKWNEEKAVALSSLETEEAELIQSKIDRRSDALQTLDEINSVGDTPDDVDQSETVHDENDLEKLKGDASEEGLVLAFGHQAFSASGLTGYPARQPGAYGIHAMSHLLEPTIKANFTHKLRVGPTDDSEVVLQPGLTIILATSNAGKTTFVRNMMRTCLRNDLTCGYISWNEREYWSADGEPHHLVGLIEAHVEQAPDVLAIDSLRKYAQGGPAPGKGGVNTSFFMNLTQWHHTMFDANIAGFVVINPNSMNDEFISGVQEICRGSVAGIMTITKIGSANYEHVGTNRKATKIEIEDTDFVLIKNIPDESSEMKSDNSPYVNDDIKGSTSDENHNIKVPSIKQGDLEQPLRNLTDTFLF